MPKSKEKILAVKFTIICGEFEFTGHCICDGKPDEKDEDIIDTFFSSYYSKLDEDYYEKAESYMYMGCQVGVKRIVWREITLEEKKILNKVGIY